MSIPCDKMPANTKVDRRCLIAGVGNILRGDDGVGVRALEYLERRLDRRKFVFRDFSTQSLDLLNHITNYRRAFIIDAVDFAGPAGYTRAFCLDDLRSFGGGRGKVSSHSISLADLLKLCRLLRIEDRVWIIGIQPKDISWSRGLSRDVSRSLDYVCRKIIDLWGTHPKEP